MPATTRQLNDWLQAEGEVRRAEEEACDERLTYLIDALPPERTIEDGNRVSGLPHANAER